MLAITKKQKSKKLLNEQRVRFEELKKIVNKYEELPTDPRDLLRMLVSFFDEISLFQDKGLFNIGTPFRMKEYFPVEFEALSVLNLHLTNAGRHEHGWNRTQLGEEVTDENVYLGDIYGLWTKNVKFWIESSDEDLHSEVRLKDSEKKASMVQVIAYCQAEPFLYSHIKGMKEQLDILLG